MDPEKVVPENPRSKIADLEKELKDIKKFCKDLIEALQHAELKHNLILLPEGTYFGKRIE